MCTLLRSNLLSYAMWPIFLSAWCLGLNWGCTSKLIDNLGAHCNFSWFKNAQHERDDSLGSQNVLFPSKKNDYLTWSYKKIVFWLDNEKENPSLIWKAPCNWCRKMPTFSISGWITILITFVSDRNIVGFTGCIGGHHSSQSFARGGFARTSGLSSAAMDVKNNVSAPYALCFRSFIYSASGRNFEPGRGSKSMNFVRGIIEEDGKDLMDFRGGSQLSRYTLEQNADIVHLKLLRNNTFVTVTDSKGNTKCKASAGCLPELKGGAKMSRYAAEATSEHVGRMSRNMGLKSVVMKVKGLTYFKKKRQAIMSWREGFTNSRGVQNPIVYIEDTTRRPHNGCRLPKRRRI